MPKESSTQGDALQFPIRSPYIGLDWLACSSEMTCRSLSPDLFFWVHFPVVTIILTDVLPVANLVPVQSIHHKGVCSYPPHLFIDVLAKVGYVKNATAYVQVRIDQVFPEAFEQG
jgi:hypothetical protein